MSAQGWMSRRLRRRPGQAESVRDALTSNAKRQHQRAGRSHEGLAGVKAAYESARAAKVAAEVEAKRRDADALRAAECKAGVERLSLPFGLVVPGALVVTDPTVLPEGVREVKFTAEGITVTMDNGSGHVVGTGGTIMAFGPRKDDQSAPSPEPVTRRPKALMDGPDFEAVVTTEAALCIDISADEATYWRFLWGGAYPDLLRVKVEAKAREMGLEPTAHGPGFGAGFGVAKMTGVGGTPVGERVILPLRPRLRQEGA